MSLSVVSDDSKGVALALPDVDVDGWTLEQHEARISEGFDQLRSVIDVASKSAMSIAQSFLEIRENRLYKTTHKTFALYCEDRWRKTERAIAYKMAAYQVVRNLAGKIDAVFDSERSLRLLSGLSPKDQLRVAKKCCANAGGSHIGCNEIRAAMLSLGLSAAPEAPVLEKSPEAEVKVVDPGDKKPESVSDVADRVFGEIVGGDGDLDSVDPSDDVLSAEDRVSGRRAAVAVSVDVDKLTERVTNTYQAALSKVPPMYREQVSRRAVESIGGVSRVVTPVADTPEFVSMTPEGVVRSVIPMIEKLSAAGRVIAMRKLMAAFGFQGFVA